MSLMIRRRGSRKNAIITPDGQVEGTIVFTVIMRRGRKPYHVRHGLTKQTATRWADEQLALA